MENRIVPIKTAIARIINRDALLYEAEIQYYNLTRPLRRALRWGRWTFLRRTLATCIRCGAPAVWRYMPSGPRRDFCDDCVSRGCNCNNIDNSVPGEVVCEDGEDGRQLVWFRYFGPEPEQHRDSRGRRLPCCEYDFDRHGWPLI